MGKETDNTYHSRVIDGYKISPAGITCYPLNLLAHQNIPMPSAHRPHPSRPLILDSSIPKSLSMVFSGAQFELCSFPLYYVCQVVVVLGEINMTTYLYGIFLRVTGCPISADILRVRTRVEKFTRKLSRARINTRGADMLAGG
jgi:hypothetical protein